LVEKKYKEEYNFGENFAWCFCKIHDKTEVNHSESEERQQEFEYLKKHLFDFDSNCFDTANTSTEGRPKRCFFIPAVEY